MANMMSHPSSPDGCIWEVSLTIGMISVLYTVVVSCMNDDLFCIICLKFSGPVSNFQVIFAESFRALLSITKAHSFDQANSNIETV